jgi:hypothetical protein
MAAGPSNVPCVEDSVVALSQPSALTLTKIYHGADHETDVMCNIDEGNQTVFQELDS